MQQNNLQYADGLYAADHYETVWNASNARDAGVASDNGYTDTKRMTLLK